MIPLYGPPEPHPRSQPQPQPYSHRQSVMSDQMSVSSATTGVTGQSQSHGQGHGHPHPHHQSYIPSSNINPTHFYPSSHIHNHPQPLSQNPYLSSPPAAAVPPPAHPPSLTSILLNSAPRSFTIATQNPFLRLSGLGSLPKPLLSRWLSQDRLYAQAYIGFIGSLIARVDLPHVNVADKSTSLRWRLVNCLSSALSNIHTELGFFADTATKYGLELDTPARPGGTFTANPATKQYIDLFRAFWTDPSMSLLEGMVVLWATEIVYLSAWTYASSFINAPEARKEGSTSTVEDDRASLSQANSHTARSSQSQRPRSPGSPPSMPATDPGSSGVPTRHHSGDLDGGALRDAFIPNWTSREFEAFVAEIAELTDQLAEREDAVTRRLDVYKAVWRHILDVETRFWPDVEGFVV